MRHSESYSRCRKNSVRKCDELPQGLSTGLFFIVLGLVLLAAFNDIFHFGSLQEYFTWPLILLYIGFLMFINLKFIAGILVMAVGGWFLLEKMGIILSPLLHNMFWPGIIIIIGAIFIISSFLKQNRKI